MGRAVDGESQSSRGRMLQSASGNGLIKSGSGGRKSLDSFDFTAIPKLDKMQVPELACCEWSTRRENVIALGPSGTGKTYVAIGLGLAACQKGLTVGFTTASALAAK